MAFGVQIGLHKALVPVTRRLHARTFTHCPSLLARGAHHSYFTRDSPVIQFPESSNYASYIPTAPTYEQARSSPMRELGDGQKWLIYCGGFFSFPLLCLGYYWGDWAFGSKLWKSEINQLEEQGLAGGSRTLLKDSHDQFMEANNLYNILQRANAETKALHDLVLLLINPDADLHAARDKLMLEDNPIRMSDGKQLDPSKAILVRIMDQESKTLVLLLAVDMSGHAGSESDPALAWCHDYALRAWLDERAEQLKKDGEAAEQGISLCCYTATSCATSLPGKRGEMWQEARLYPEELPSGFPLKMLEGVKEEVTPRTP